MKESFNKSVRDSVMADPFVYRFVATSTSNFVWNSVNSSVRAYVYNSVWAVRLEVLFGVSVNSRILFSI